MECGQHETRPFDHPFPRARLALPCQGGAREAASTAPGLEQKRASWQEKTEPVSFSTNYFYASGGIGEKRAAWGEDAVSRAIMDLTGVRLVMPNGYQSLEQCRASGDMPDMPYLFVKSSVALNLS